jgi:hypothetical protein
VTPPRHQALLDDAPAAAFAAPAPPPDRDLPPVSPPRNYDRDNDRHSDSTNDKSGDRGSYDSRPDYAPDNDETSNGPRMVLGRDGHWYLLRSNGR